MYQFQGYNPLNDDDESDQFISDNSVDILKEGIKDQFINPIDDFKRDYVESFINMYNFSRKNQDEDDVDDITRIYDDFIVFMKNIMSNNLSIGFPTIDNEGEDEQLELIQLTYRFFIRRIKKNFKGVVLKYIHDNEEFLLDELPKKKDVTTMNFENIVNDLDLRVLSNMDTVIELALERDYTVDEFLDACCYVDTSTESGFVKESFDSNTLTGNFVEFYTGMVNDDLKGELASKIRNSILKDYPMKKKKDDLNEE